MRILSAFTIAAFVAATPCMAQVVITPSVGDTTRHDDRAEHHEYKAQRDAQHAREDASVGDYRGAAHEQAEAQHHQAIAQDQQQRADQDRRPGVHVEIGR
jgi:hypothetical protein